MKITREEIQDKVCEVKCNIVELKKVEDITSGLLDYIEQLKAELADYQGLCRRTKAILDDELFWDKTNSKDGWHSSLHNDLRKASNSKYSDLMYKKAMEVIGTLEGQKLKLEAELATLKEGVVHEFKALPCKNDGSVISTSEDYDEDMKSVHEDYDNLIYLVADDNRINPIHSYKVTIQELKG